MAHVIDSRAILSKGGGIHGGFVEIVTNGPMHLPPVVSVTFARVNPALRAWNLLSILAKSMLRKNVARSSLKRSSSPGLDRYIDETFQWSCSARKRSRDDCNLAFYSNTFVATVELKRVYPHPLVYERRHHSLHRRPDDLLVVVCVAKWPLLLPQEL